MQDQKTGTLRGVIYARYSSDNQREESIDGQLRECHAYADAKGIEIVHEYIDRAFSARTDERPDFQKMINDSEGRGFDAVLVWKLDRFSRSRYDSLRYRAVLGKRNIKVISATENISDSPEGILLESVLDGINEYYSADLAQKIKRGNTDNVLEGKWNGGRPAYGYRTENQRFVVDEKESEAVKLVYRLYTTTNCTINSLVCTLNAKGYRGRDGKPFHHGSVCWMLRNRKYIGEFSCGGTVNKSCVPPLIDLKTFEKAQAKLKRNSRASARFKAQDDYILTTKLYCGDCGAYMAGDSTDKRSGRVYRYYTCRNVKRNHSCHKKSVNKEFIETLVVNEALKFLNEDGMVSRLTEAIYAAQFGENPRLGELEGKIADLDRKMSNLINAIEGGMAYEGLKERYDELAAKKKELSHELEEEKLDNPTLSKDQIQYALLRFQAADIDTIEGKKALIWTFINSVFLYDQEGGYAIVNFNYRSHTPKVSLESVKNGQTKVSLADSKCPYPVFVIQNCFQMKVSFEKYKKLSCKKA
ncbi:MAG: recombinase family protein [Bacilli bacterium]|jgi:site-specific DNA recombinase|nr:recombinase family protein [Bacilli bacterium]